MSNGKHPPTTALLVVDMQNSFLSDDGVLARLRGQAAGVHELRSATRDAIAAARALGLPVIYTRHAYRPDYADAGTFLRRIVPEVMDHQGLVLGTRDADVVDELAPVEGDLVIDKSCYDAFTNPLLERTLRLRRITRLLVAGVNTHICVEATVRSAFRLGFDSVVLSDCTGTRSERLRDISLEVMAAGHFAAVRPWREALEELQ